jgi:hypothetical protein
MTHPEALRLADRLDCGEISYSGMCKAAAELRRLHESNQELIAALKEMLDGENKSFRELCEQARAAIAKGKTK